MSDADKFKWIPVTERLPDDSNDVLITYYCGKEMHDPEIVKMVEESPFLNENVFKMPYMMIAFYIEGDNGIYVWACGEGDEIPDGVHVTAWMPLPEPYKEVDR